MSFDEIFTSYIEKYTEHKKVELKLNLIKQGMKNHYNNQDERSLNTNGVIVRLKTKKDYRIKEEIYDYLEDYGYLPLVVKVNKSLEKHFSLKDARINKKQSVRLYTGGKSIVDSKSITNQYSYLLEYNLDDLSKEFKQSATEEKLKKAQLEEIKEQLKQSMPSNSVSTDYGNLKITETYEYDIDVVFDGVSGKKEVFIKKLSANGYKIVVFPEETELFINGEDLLGNFTVEHLFNNTSDNLESLFVKKRTFNKMIKEEFVFNKFEVEMDPYEFLKKCEISKTKINDLVQQGIINEKDILPYLEIVGETEFIEVLNEGAAEQQVNLYNQKLLERSENYRRRKDNNYAKDSTSSRSEEMIIDITNFDF
ncbi:hypothetical protein [Priestia aryabhattai]